MFHFPKHIAVPATAPDITAALLRKCQRSHIRVTLTEATTREYHLHSEHRFVETHLRGKLRLAHAPRPVWFGITFVTLYLNDEAHDTALAVDTIRVVRRDEAAGEETTVFPHPDDNIRVYTINDIDTVIAETVKYLLAAANNAVQS